MGLICFILNSKQFNWSFTLFVRIGELCFEMPSLIIRLFTLRSMSLLTTSFLIFFSNFLSLSVAALFLAAAFVDLR